MAENSYYWLRLKRDFFKRHDIQIIESMQNGKDYILFYLKLLCESVDHEGNLRFSEQVPYSAEMLSVITNTNIDIVKSAIQVFTSLGMMDIMDDGTYYMNEVQKMLGFAKNDDHTRESTRLRVQAFRERKKQELLEEKRYSNVTCNGELEIELELEKELDIKKVKKKTVTDYFPGNPELNQTFLDYIEMRKKIKAPMTDKAIELAIGKLQKLSNGNEDLAKQIIEQSIMNSWKGLFEIHGSKSENKLTQQYDMIAQWASQ